MSLIDVSNFSNKRLFSNVVLWQGLYEYVRPSWEARPRPANVDLDLKTFGATIPQRPTLGDSEAKGDMPR